jgi:hypothetical protein
MKQWGAMLATASTTISFEFVRKEKRVLFVEYVEPELSC